MSRYALQRMGALLHGRMQLRWYPRPLSSAAEQPSTDAVHMTDNCIRRLKELHTTGSSNEGKMLRLGVETGGCSGFQYVFCLDDKKNEDDRVFDKDGVKLVVDNVSYDFVKGATVDYVEELIRSAFLVSMAELLEQKDRENWLLDIKMQMDDSEGLTLGRKFCMYVFSRRTWSISIRRIAVDES